MVQEWSYHNDEVAASTHSPTLDGREGTGENSAADEMQAGDHKV